MTYIDVKEYEALVDEIRTALEGDSNDAEHDALVSVAYALEIHYDINAGDVDND